MDFSEYQKKATQTFKPGERIDIYDSRLCDWALGVSSEAGEVAGLIKHQVFHKQEVSRMTIAKEIGDVLWYLSALCQSLDISLSDCAKLNIAKLAHRHDRGKFSFKGSSERHSREHMFEDTKEYQEIRRRVLNE